MVKALQAEKFQEVQEFAQEVLAVLPKELVAAAPGVNMQESPLGNIIADSLIHSLAAAVSAPCAVCRGPCSLETVESYYQTL